MSDKPKGLADFAAFEISGPTVVFLRPRRRYSLDEMASIAGALRTTQRPNLEYVLVSDEFDVMPMGEVQLRERGWVKLPAP